MKFRYLVGFAALALLASCSKDAPDEKAWVYDESLPVPVTFSAPRVMIQPTKAMIEGTSLDGYNVGVFALADGEGAWTGARGDLVMLYNETGTVTEEGTGNAGSLKFSSTVYYPMSSDQNFTFYAYHSPDGRVQLNEEGSVVSLTYSLGYTDVLWAKSEATPVETAEGEPLSGFNGRYVRHIEQTYVGNQEQLNTYLPRLNFEHKLAALKFTVVDQSGADETLTLHRIGVENAITQATLCIASKDPSVQSGTISPGDGNGEATRGRIYVVKPKPGGEEGTTTDLDYVVNTEGIDAGHLLVYPSATEGYELVLQLKWGDGSVEEVRETLTGNFEPGKVYGYRVVVNNGPQTIQAIPVTLKEWNDGFAESGNGDLSVGAE